MNHRTEQWADIPGWVGFYQASSLGNIRSVERVIYAKNNQGVVGPRLYKSRVLRPRVAGTNDYPMVVLSRPKSKPKTATIHSLVALAFIGPCPVGKEVCHRDDNPQNNALINLRYDTRLSNATDATLNGKRNAPRGSRVHAAKLSEAQVVEIRTLSKRLSQRDIAKKFSLSHTTIGRILRREGWAHV